LISSAKLEKQKAQVLLRCQHDRLAFHQALDEVDQQTHWSQLIGHAAILGAPRLAFLMPVVGFFVSQKLLGRSGKSNLLTKLSLATALVKKAGDVVAKYRKYKSPS